LASACREAGEEGEVVVHYLGHASFLLAFPHGPTVLTDYGESNAYGLDSPVFPLGHVRPDIVTLSHDHPDHAGGILPEPHGAVLRGASRHEEQGLTITPIPTHENDLEQPDNVSFLFEYGGVRILHLGDCQGLMTFMEAAGVRDRIQTLYPDRYDLVLLPIGFVREILSQAAEFVTLLNADVIVPMHYWDPQDQERFLDIMRGMTDGGGRPYQVRPGGGAVLRVPSRGDPPPLVEVVGLTPGPTREQ
jgi:L-ascorbate metabolism protein UlaG (beta-lactamase superfamily)